MKTEIFRRKAITFLGITAVLLAAAAFTAGRQNTQRLISVQTARAYESTL